MCKGHFWKSCDSADKRAKYIDSVCVCLFWLGGAEALRQCEVEVRPRRHGCGVVTSALTHASCSSLAPEVLLSVMSFDSCHLWVSSRSYDMDSVFLSISFIYLFFERVTTIPTTKERSERTLGDPYQTTGTKKEVCWMPLETKIIRKLFLEACFFTEMSLI